jgi:phage tail protein X
MLKRRNESVVYWYWYTTINNNQDKNFSSLPIGGLTMDDRLSKYNRIEKAEGEKITPTESSKPAAQSKGQMHTVAAEETLSHIALKYYGSAAKEKWIIIYEANKELIGDNPNIIRRGMDLFIPDIEE